MDLAWVLFHSYRRQHCQSLCFKMTDDAMAAANMQSVYTFMTKSAAESRHWVGRCITGIQMS